MKTAASKRSRKTITTAARRSAFKDKNTVPCNYCGKGLSYRTATGDHMQPISKGGQNKQKNIVMACADCNQRKGSMERGTFMKLMRDDGTYQAKRKGKKVRG